jgi:hypothetical protein
VIGFPIITYRGPGSADDVLPSFAPKPAAEHDGGKHADELRRDERKDVRWRDAR